jgi:hypothetical protein
MAPPDRRLASSARHQRTDRSGQQLDQAGETSRLRVPVFPALSGQGTALRRPARLVTPGHHHAALIPVGPGFLPPTGRHRSPASRRPIPVTATTTPSPDRRSPRYRQRPPRTRPQRPADHTENTRRRRARSPDRHANPTSPRPPQAPAPAGSRPASRPYDQGLSPSTPRLEDSPQTTRPTAPIPPSDPKRRFTPISARTAGAGALMTRR